MENSAFYNFGVAFLIVLCGVMFLFAIIFGILELIFSKRKSDQYIKEKNVKELIKKFYGKMDVVSTQSTQEILECLIEMEDLDKLYDEIIESDIEFMDEMSYLKTKEDILNKIIKDKIDNSSNSIEDLQSLLSEIDVCKSRYPKYNGVFVSNTNLVKKRISEL